MKQFLLFAAHTYYPGGGWDDFRGSYDAANEALCAGREGGERNWDWWRVIDTATQTVLTEEDNGLYPGR